MTGSALPDLTSQVAPQGARDGVHIHPGPADRWPLVLPLSLSAGLVALAFTATARLSWPLQRSLVGAAAFLSAWNAILLLRAVMASRAVSLRVVLRKQHYLQACAQGSVLLYWGWYWRPVYDSAPLILAQLLFAYGFDMLLSWSRRDTYVLGFGPFPVIFSINLFLWFKPDWFYLQFLLVALGFAAKDLIRWSKDGRHAHIFNPSSFPLAVFSLALLATGTTALTRGQEIATTQFYPPHMYLVLFLVGLPGQFFFGVTTMTMAAVLTTYVAGLLYYLATGVYFFYDSYIPIAVFLGMHLLFTDPSTSPRTETGRLMFGASYGLSTMALYALLGWAGMPTFYDKLLQVPVLNLSIKLLDRAAGSRLLRGFDPSRIGRSLVPRLRHLGYMSIWAAAFTTMSAFQGVGDDHRGQWLPFWQQACDQEHRGACPYYESLVSAFCDRGSGWACNEIGVLEMTRERNRPAAIDSMVRGCELGFPPACANAETLAAVAGVAAADAGALLRPPPRPQDYPIVLRGSKGPLVDQSPDTLAALACREGWADACKRPRATP